ncbi:hypothetical protein PBRA_005793 [Plasmodiophora brassicae]|uniref:C2 NT-type domain-containing protein n=1 Tax=Plasmodiophora brassicae TaxID=37360 RepID=A0A0G4IRA8_PLABS|nr:hypothetical protein PBRA_005793 [Plasmodiophora brassicae]
MATKFFTRVRKTPVRYKFEISLIEVRLSKPVDLPITITWTRGRKQVRTGEITGQQGRYRWTSPLKLACNIYKDASRPSSPFQTKPSTIALQIKRRSGDVKPFAQVRVDLAQFCPATDNSLADSLAVREFPLDQCPDPDATITIRITSTCLNGADDFQSASDEPSESIAPRRTGRTGSASSSESAEESSTLQLDRPPTTTTTGGVRVQAKPADEDELRATIADLEARLEAERGRLRSTVDQVDDLSARLFQQEESERRATRVADVEKAALLQRVQDSAQQEIRQYRLRIVDLEAQLNVSQRSLQDALKRMDVSDAKVDDAVVDKAGDLDVLEKVVLAMKASMNDAIERQNRQDQVIADLQRDLERERDKASEAIKTQQKMLAEGASESRFGKLRPVKSIGSTSPAAGAASSEMEKDLKQAEEKVASLRKELAQAHEQVATATKSAKIAESGKMMASKQLELERKWRETLQQQIANGAAGGSQPASAPDEKLRAQVADLEAQRAVASQQGDLLRSRVAELEAQLAGERDKLQKALDEARTAQEAARDASRTAAELRGQVGNAGQTRRLEEEIEELKAVHARELQMLAAASSPRSRRSTSMLEVDNVRMELEKELTSVKADLDTATAAQARLTAELKQVSDERDQLASKARASEGSGTMAAQQLVIERKWREGLQQQLNDLAKRADSSPDSSKKADELQRQVQEVGATEKLHIARRDSERSVKLQEQLRKEAGELEGARRDVELARRDVESARREAQAATRETQAERAAKAAVQAEMKALQAALDSSRASASAAVSPEVIMTMKRERDDLVQRVRDAEFDRDRLNGEIDRLRDQVDGVVREKNDLGNMNGQLRKENTNMSKQLKQALAVGEATVRNAVQDLKASPTSPSRLDDAQARLWERRAKDAEEMLVMAQKSFAETTKILEERSALLDAELNETRARLVAATQEHAEKDEEIEKLKKKLQLGFKERLDMSEYLNELEIDLANNKARFVDTIDELSNLENENMRLREKLASVGVSVSPQRKPNPRFPGDNVPIKQATQLP